LPISFDPFANSIEGFCKTIDPFLETIERFRQTLESPARTFEQFLPLLRTIKKSRNAGLKGIMGAWSDPAKIIVV